MKNNLFNQTFIFFVLALFSILFLMPMSRQGMFVDGIWYAAIANNMANGLGSIWDPALSKTMFLHFREHPSFAMAMQSVFFKLLGDGFWVEKIYAFINAILQLGLIYKLWLSDNRKPIFSFFIILYFWLLIPISLGMYKNNMLEASLTLYATIACLSLLTPAVTSLRFALRSIFAGTCLVLGFMCNGPTVLFPLIMPLLYGRIIEKRAYRYLILPTLILLFITIGCFTVFFSVFPGALLNLQGYFKIQLLASINGSRDLSYTGWGHFNIVYIFFKDYIWLNIVIFFTMFIDARQQKKSLRHVFKLQASNPYFKLYLLLSLCASLPVGISHRQMFHYISPSVPMYLLAMLYLSYPSFIRFFEVANNFMKNKSLKWLRSLSMVGAVLSFLIVILTMGSYNKNQHLIEDVNHLSQLLAPENILIGSHNVMSEFDIPANFARQSNLAFLEPNILNLKNNNYYIYFAGEDLPKGFKPWQQGFRAFKIAKR